MHLFYRPAAALAIVMRDHKTGVTTTNGTDFAHELNFCDDDYGPEVDALSVEFSQEAVAESDEDKPGVVLDDIDEENRAVQIVAIGEKQGERLIVGGEEVEL